MDHICQWGANKNPWAGYRMGLSYVSITPKAAVKKTPFNLQSNGWDDENVKRAHLSTLWLAVLRCHEQSCSFRQSSKCVNDADLVQHMQPGVKQPDHRCGDGFVVSTRPAVRPGYDAIYRCKSYRFVGWKTRSSPQW